jgi:16S rRNA (cytosine1402-N4)-methyltransferase
MAVPLTHVPVLCDRVVEWLQPSAPGLLVDVTVGAGGHAAALLEAEPGFRLLGIDRDPEALEAARRRLHTNADRIELLQSTFDKLPEVLARRDLPPPSAILADLGCSSLQLDSAERGFSFLTDGPLDMRMDSAGPSAADLVNNASEDELVNVLRTFGEERRSRAVARSIVDHRRREPIRSTLELSRLVERAVGWSPNRRIHPATRTFQGLRIAVNDELGQIERFLEPAVRVLRPHGRMAVISFHSLEDRLVKHSFRRLEGRCVCPPELPECGCNPERVLRVLTRRAVRPSTTEMETNRRSRSARLRVIERLEGGG